MSSVNTKLNPKSSNILTKFNQQHSSLMTKHDKSQFLQRISAPKTEYKEKSPKKVNENLELHSSIHNFHTIKWLRRKLGKDFIIKSINTLLPNNGQARETEDNKLQKFLETYLKLSPEIQGNLNPNYMFSNNTMSKIFKLRDIFLEFDEDESRKLELNEMVEMFNSNNIFTQMEQLCSLFFPDKDQNKIDMEKQYLDFYQFMEFALSAQADQNFRNFMRDLKFNMVKLNRVSQLTHQERDKNDKKSTRHNAICINPEERPSFSNYTRSGETDKYVEGENEKPQFLPMNFNLVLDYFNKKGKVRSWEKTIHLALKKIEKYLTANSDKKFKDEFNSINSLYTPTSKKASHSQLDDLNPKKEVSKFNINNKHCTKMGDSSRRKVSDISSSRGNISNSKNTESKNLSLYDNEEEEEESEIRNFKVTNLENHNQIEIEELFDCFEKLFNQQRPREQISSDNDLNDNSSKSLNPSNKPSTYLLDMPTVPITDRIDKSIFKNTIQKFNVTDTNFSLKDKDKRDKRFYYENKDEMIFSNILRKNLELKVKHERQIKKEFKDQDKNEKEIKTITEEQENHFLESLNIPQNNQQTVNGKKKLLTNFQEHHSNTIKDKPEVKEKVTVNKKFKTSSTMINNNAFLNNIKKSDSTFHMNTAENNNLSTNIYTSTNNNLQTNSNYILNTQTTMNDNIRNSSINANSSYNKKNNSPKRLFTCASISLQNKELREFKDNNLFINTENSVKSPTMLKTQSNFSYKNNNMSKIRNSIKKRTTLNNIKIDLTGVNIPLEFNNNNNNDFIINQTYKKKQPCTTKHISGLTSQKINKDISVFRNNSNNNNIIDINNISLSSNRGKNITNALGTKSFGKEDNKNNSKIKAVNRNKKHLGTINSAISYNQQNTSSIYNKHNDFYNYSVNKNNKFDLPNLKPLYNDISSFTGNVNSMLSTDVGFRKKTHYPNILNTMEKYNKSNYDWRRNTEFENLTRNLNNASRLPDFIKNNL